MKLKLKYLIFIIIGIALMYLYPFMRNVYKAEINNMSVQKHLFVDYQRLLKNLQKNEIDSNNEFTYYYKVTSPISMFKYNNLYSVLIYKIETRNLKSLDSCLVFQNFPSKESLDIPYSGVEGSYSFKFLAKKFPVFHPIIFSLFGDSIRLIKRNDSLVNYFAYFRNFSIRTEESQRAYIYGSCATEDKTPISILFLKRDSTVYLLTMTQSSAIKKSFSVNFLLNLIDSSLIVQH